MSDTEIQELSYNERAELIKELEREIAAKDAELTQLKTILSDPNAVRLKMQRGTIAWTVETLESVMGNSIAARDAMIADLQAKVDVAEGWGFTFGICKSTDCPEGRMMAGEHKEGSTLARMFDEWSGGIGDKVKLKKQDATIEKLRLENKKFLNAFTSAERNFQIARGTIEELRAALNEYGNHECDCDAEEGEDCPCTCGFSQALTETSHE